MKIEQKHSKIFFYLLIIGFFFLLIYMILLYSNQVFAQTLEQPEVLTHNSQIIPQPEIQEVKIESLLAKSFVIYDINNKKVVRSSNAQLPLPIASLTKIITVGTLMEQAKRNKIELREETKLRIKKALINSSNEDADSLGEIYSYSFGRNLIDDSNTLAQNLGISSIHLSSLTGLDNADGSASNIGSAESIAKFFAYDYENFRDIFEYTKFDEVDSLDGKIVNTNHSSESTFGMVASKTGFTYEAGGNLGIVVTPEPGSAYVIVVMNSTYDGRFKDMQKLVKALPLILRDQ
jgi:D-alanyl-D-alanine carboxypeptidase